MTPMRHPALLLLLALSGCGVSRADFDAKAHEAEVSKQEAEGAKGKLALLQQQLAEDEKQVGQLKGSLGIAQSQAMTDEQKSQLDEAKRAVQEAQERGKLLDDLQTKFKKMIDAGHLKVTTRHGRVVLQLHNDVLFDTGSADVKATGKQKLFPTNWELSTARAIAVVKLLTAQGVDPTTLSAAGYGPYDPVAPNATPDGMAKNRRIEITLVPHVAD